VTIARTSWRALGSTAELLELGYAGELERAREALECTLEEIDRACSRFRADSELTRVNRAAGRELAVSPLLLEAVELALRGARITDGDVDPTLGRALEQAGYDCDWELLSGRADAPLAADADTGARALVRARRRRGWSAVRIDRSRSTIRLPRGVKLDLGATAKAWAADRGAAAAAAAAGCGVLVSLGGDIATAGPPPREGWRVHVTDDHRSAPSAPGQTVAIDSGGLATSSTVVRRWRRAGQAMHHIIDPATEAPARSPWRTVSVAAANCADANIAATAAIVGGERSPRWLAVQGLPARLVACDGAVTTVGSWPREAQPAVGG